MINVFLWSVHSNDSIILASITVKQQAKYIHLSSLTPYHLFLWISNQASHTLLLESKPFEHTPRLPTGAFPCTPPHSTPLLPPIITSKSVLSLLGLKRCLFPGFFPVPLSISLTHPRCLSFTSTGVSWWGLCSLTDLATKALNCELVQGSQKLRVRCYLEYRLDNYSEEMISTCPVSLALLKGRLWLFSWKACLVSSELSSFALPLSSFSALAMEDAAGSAAGPGIARLLTEALHCACFHQFWFLFSL